MFSLSFRVPFLLLWVCIYISGDSLTSIAYSSSNSPQSSPDTDVKGGDSLNFSEVFIFKDMEENKWGEEDKLYLMEAFSRLARQSLGNLLITRVKTELKGNSLPLIKAKGSTAFSNNPFLCLEINVAQLKTSRVGCIGSKVRIALPNGQGVDAYEIGSCINPPEITLGHELVHALHYLLDSQQFAIYKEKYTPNQIWHFLNRKMKKKQQQAIAISLLNTPPKRRGSIPKSFLEKQAGLARQRRGSADLSGGGGAAAAAAAVAVASGAKVPQSIEEEIDAKLWDFKQSEQLAVIGVPLTSSFFKNQRDGLLTEWNLRVELCLSPRYGYHLHTRHFYEDALIIEMIFKEKGIANFAEQLGGWYCNDWEFNPQTAFDSSNVFSIVNYQSDKDGKSSLDDERKREYGAKTEKPIAIPRIDAVLIEPIFDLKLRHVLPKFREAFAAEDTSKFASSLALLERGIVTNQNEIWGYIFDEFVTEANKPKFLRLLRQNNLYLMWKNFIINSMKNPHLHFLEKLGYIKALFQVSPSDVPEVIEAIPSEKEKQEAKALYK